MIFYKNLTGKEVLEAVAIVVGMYLPEHLAKKNYELHISFDDDYGVDIHLTNPDEEEETLTNN